MRQLLTRSRAPIEFVSTSARRLRRYRPRCTPLEDRRLLTASLTFSGPPVPLVGARVTWTATDSDLGPAPVYQFSVSRDGGSPQVIRDFSPLKSVIWNPLEEGSYAVSVIVKAGYDDTSGDSAAASYTAQSRVLGDKAVVSPMDSNTLVALYSAPPSAGGSMYVQFRPAGTLMPWTSTSPLPIVPGRSTNFIVAGMLANTKYVMRHVLDDGSVSGQVSFTTGAIPASINTAPISNPKPSTLQSDLTQNTVLHFGVSNEPDFISFLATDRAGNISWYYQDPLSTSYARIGVSLPAGGSMYVLARNIGPQTDPNFLREIDLAGDTLRETSIYALNPQLVAMGKHPISDIHHDAQRLPNGDTAILIHSRRTVDLNGVPTEYVGDGVVILDQNFQAKWMWDAFDWLDTNRLGTLGEKPTDWLHSNTVAYSPTDGNLIISLRAQDWVVKFNYADGAGDGHVIWRLGQGGDFTINSSDPSPWFSHQHDVRYVNDSTLVLFDNSDVRHVADPKLNNRGQVLILDEKTMQATLQVNADLGVYSYAVGSAQRLPNGNYSFTSGVLGLLPLYGQTIEVTPDGTKTFIQQIDSFEYRGYQVDDLYGNLTGLVDPGFEDPPLASTAYKYQPRGTAWSFTGSAGVAGDRSVLTSGNPKAPQGSQVAYLQKTGTISQVVAFSAPGSYEIGVSAAQRGNVVGASGTIEVRVDGAVVGTFTPGGTKYTNFTTAAFKVAAGDHVITFAGVNPSGADTTVLLDRVSIDHNSPGNSSSRLEANLVVEDASVNSGAAETDPTTSIPIEVEPKLAAGDSNSPTVAGVRVVSRKGAIGQIIVAFSEAMDPTGVANLGAYRLIAAGRDGRFGTRDDKVVALRSAAYSPATNSVRLVTRGRLAARQRLQVWIGGTPADRALNRLDGDGDGRPGGKYIGRLGV